MDRPCRLNAPESCSSLRWRGSCSSGAVRRVQLHRRGAEPVNTQPTWSTLPSTRRQRCTFFGGGYFPASTAPATTATAVPLRQRPSRRYSNQTYEPFRVQRIIDVGNDSQYGERKVLLDGVTPAEDVDPERRTPVRGTGPSSSQASTSRGRGRSWRLHPRWPRMNPRLASPAGTYLMATAGSSPS